ncbi:MAG: radical SAM protein [Bacteroidaceae bacterium]|nr:radical SAM protein [Bacteroidaceae bacterium]
MPTIIYPSPIFGPVKSRRFGVSLGINLMPADGKICTFDCIYCECGFNKDFRPKQKRPSREEVSEALETMLQKMKADGALPDVLTFAGNGEPTAHPDFASIIDDTVALRDNYCPQCQITVLSNATMLHKKEVVEALLKVDNNCQKLDTVDNQYISFLDRPQSPAYQVDDIVEQLCQFKGKVIIQTMFLDGEYCGKNVCNTGEEYLIPWIETLKKISPQKVMIYTIDRETPAKGLKKTTHETLDNIAARLAAASLPCSVSY